MGVPPDEKAVDTKVLLPNVPFQTNGDENSGLKRRSQRTRAKIHSGNQESTDSYACLKTIKQNLSFFFFFLINNQLRKNQAKDERP
jgi:hypothetical protein